LAGLGGLFLLLGGLQEQLVCLVDLGVKVVRVLQELTNINHGDIKEHTSDLACVLLSKDIFNLRIDAVTDELFFLIEVLNSSILLFIVLRERDSLRSHLLLLLSLQ
jgi:hypothetical protein